MEYMKYVGLIEEREGKITFGKFGVKNTKN